MATLPPEHPFHSHRAMTLPQSTNTRRRVEQPSPLSPFISGGTQSVDHEPVQVDPVSTVEPERDHSSERGR